LKSLKQIAKASITLFKAELPFIEKMEATYITDEGEVLKRLEEANKIYEARDLRVRDLHDEDVDEFYQCTLCQSFAPTNVCVVSPDRTALCGAMNWFDSRAAARVDPEGPNAPIPKGDCIDPIGGEYTGVNEAAVKLSGGEFNSIKLHSFLEQPHTSCGCFEVAGFYIPEVDGIGWVHRGSRVADTPIGLPFSSIASSVGGGKQVEGFLGIGIQYFYSPKFIQYDGGWQRVVWMASDLKERVQDAIPTELWDKIATEKDVKNINELRDFLRNVEHPVVTGVVRAADGVQITNGWAAPAAVAAEAGVARATEAELPGGALSEAEAISPFPLAQQMQAGGASPVTIVLKDADIRIGKIIIKKREAK
jgi:acetyl-CoA decarbonylase/synthase complex subunit beta